ncbi:MAG: hypothetical protein KDA62_13770 [Planctomycetales bacterium]|nr:hypothetical protein [Planctomycetales bacterium]
MAVRCAKCNEELLGAVNRCWRCGTPFASRGGDVNEPPLRRRPPVPETFAAAMIVAEPADVESRTVSDGAGSDGGVRVDENVRVAEAASSVVAESSGSADNSGTTGSASRSETATSTTATPNSANRKTPIRRGSPFAANVEAALHSSAAWSEPQRGANDRHRRSTLVPQYPQRSAAQGGAIAAFVVGWLAFGFSFFTIAALIVSLLGLALGIWGLYSDRRGMALIGIFLCCIAIAIAGFRGAVDLYIMLYQVNPLDEAGGALDFPLE